MISHNHPAGDLIVLDTGEVFVSSVFPHCQHVTKPQGKVSWKSFLLQEFSTVQVTSGWPQCDGMINLILWEPNLKPLTSSSKSFRTRLLNLKAGGPKRPKGALSNHSFGPLVIVQDSVQVFNQASMVFLALKWHIFRLFKPLLKGQPIACPP